jgi:hypothetical protein
MTLNPSKQSGMSKLPINGKTSFFGPRAKKYSLSNCCKTFRMGKMNGDYQKHFPEDATFLKAPLFDLPPIEIIFSTHVSDYYYQLFFKGRKPDETGCLKFIKCPV